MRIYWSMEAKAQLLAIQDYIMLDNPVAALDVVAQIADTAAKTLKAYPFAGRAGRVRGTRELVIADTAYIAVYRIMDDKIFIAAVLHNAQRWPKRLPSE